MELLLQRMEHFFHMAMDAAVRGMTSVAEGKNRCIAPCKAKREQDAPATLVGAIHMPNLEQQSSGSFQLPAQRLAAIRTRRPVHAASR